MPGSGFGKGRRQQLRGRFGFGRSNDKESRLLLDPKGLRVRAGEGLVLAYEPQALTRDNSDGHSTRLVP